MGQRDEAAIRARAYQLWAQSGYIDGQHDFHWRQAERELDRSAPEPAAVRPSEAERHVDGISSLPSMEDAGRTPPRGDPAKR